MHGSTTQGGDHDPKHPVPEGAPAAQGGAIQAPGIPRAPLDGLARRPDPLAEIAEHGVPNVPTAGARSRDQRLFPSFADTRAWAGLEPRCGHSSAEPDELISR